MIDNNPIILYPGNWLYNAGVVGLLKIISDDNYLIGWTDDEKFIFASSGELIINRKVFEKINLERIYFSDEKVVSIIGKNPYYRNFIDSKGIQKNAFEALVRNLSEAKNLNKLCYLCSHPYFIVNVSSIESQPSGKKFLEKVQNFDFIHNSTLGPSKQFPNARWNLDSNFKMCHICIYMLIHHRLALTKLFDKSQIFINAPSFKLMYELNNLVQAMYATDSNLKTKREILAISLIEYSRRLSLTLGQWTQLNTEIVIITGDNIDFFSLPYNVVRIITDRKIANLLVEIGDTNILRLVLDEKYPELIDLGYKILRISLINNDEFKKFKQNNLKDLIKSEKNRNNPTEFANKLLMLYSLIEEKFKGVIL